MPTTKHLGPQIDSPAWFLCTIDTERHRLLLPSAFGPDTPWGAPLDGFDALVVLAREREIYLQEVDERILQTRSALFARVSVADERELMRIDLRYQRVQVNNRQLYLSDPVRLVLSHYGTELADRCFVGRTGTRFCLISVATHRQWMSDFAGDFPDLP